MSNTPTTTVLSYSPPTGTGPATVEVACPLGCIERRANGAPVTDAAGKALQRTHVHTVGIAGSAPTLGERAAACSPAAGTHAGYVLTDEDGLIPAVLEATP